MQLLNKWGKEWWKFFYWLRNFLINDCRTFQPVTCELSIQQKRVECIGECCCQTLGNFPAIHCWIERASKTNQYEGNCSYNTGGFLSLGAMKYQVIEQFMNSLSNGGEWWSQKLVLGRYVGKQVDLFCRHTNM